MTELLYAEVDPSQVKPGWLGLAVVVGLLVVTFLLWRSMNHQLKKVDFEEPETPSNESPPSGDEEEPPQRPTRSPYTDSED